MKVSLFIPCYIHQLKPSIGISIDEFLKKLGCTVSVLQDALCCGQAAYNAGFFKDSKPVITKFISTFKQEDIIIVPSASCAGFLKNYAPNLYVNDSLKDQQIVEKTMNNIFEFSDFIYKYFDLQNLELEYYQSIGFQASCASLREYSCADNTMKLLNKIKNLDVIPFNDEQTCCGFGGSFADKFSDISISMAKHKLDMILQQNITSIVSNDYSCLFHLESVAKKLKHELHFLHLAELLNSLK